MVGRSASGVAHHVQSDPQFGRLPPGLLDPERQAAADALRAEWTTETVLPDTEFDELVVGGWLHIEQMDTGKWWMSVGGVTVLVNADRDGKPKRVTVFGPHDYDAPVEGCTYECTWSEEGSRA